MNKYTSRYIKLHYTTDGQNRISVFVFIFSATESQDLHEEPASSSTGGRGTTLEEDVASPALEHSQMTDESVLSPFPDPQHCSTPHQPSKRNNKFLYTLKLTLDLRELFVYGWVLHAGFPREKEPSTLTPWGHEGGIPAAGVPFQRVFAGRGKGSWVTSWMPAWHNRWHSASVRPRNLLQCSWPVWRCWPRSLEHVFWWTRHLAYFGHLNALCNATHFAHFWKLLINHLST